MSKATTKTLVPNLRFPEFWDAEEWKEKPLGKICKVNPPTSNLPDKFIYIDLESVVSENLILKKELYKSDAPSRAQRLLKNGDVIYQMVRPYQKNNFFFNTDDGNDYVASTGYAQLRAYSVNTFLFQLIHTDVFVEEVLSKCTGSNYPAIRATDLASIKTTVPKSEEQQKIADCLSSIDELITAHSQKHEALKVHKKGLMQQLFPAEGDDCMDAGGRATQDAKAGTTPKLRFPEFQDAGEWAEQLLGDIATVRSGSTPLRSNSYFYEGGNIPWVKTTDLNNSFIFCTEECITSQAKAKINPEGSVLVAMYGGFNQIGRTGYLKVPAATNQALSVLNSDRKIIIPIYLLMWLNAKVEIWKSIASSSRKDPNIKGSDVASFPIIYPKINEQQKIADCLSSIDDLITAQVQKIESLKAHKKGLMQQLFPAADEVNG